jgi:hypothetical protein
VGSLVVFSTLCYYCSPSSFPNTQPDNAGRMQDYF